MVTARHARQRSCIQLTHAGRYKNAPPSTAQHHTTHANIPWACTRRQCEATNHLADSHRPPRTVRKRTRTDCKRHRWKSNRRTTGPPGLLPNRHQRKEKKNKRISPNIAGCGFPFHHLPHHTMQAFKHPKHTHQHRTKNKNNNNKK